MSMSYQKLRDNCPSWHAYTHHEFVQQLGTGTLAEECFRHYLKQDYLFILQYTRILGLSIYKTTELKYMRWAQSGINAMLDSEIAMHLDYCRQWGIQPSELEQTIESSATIAYSRFMLDAGMSGSFAELIACISPCLMGYGEIGKRLKTEQMILSSDSHKLGDSQQHSKKDNPYQSWIDLYAGEAYQTLMADSENFIDEVLADATPTQQENYQRLFNTTARMEVNFWQMGLDLSQ